MRVRLWDARDLLKRVMRRDFSRPGFAWIALSPGASVGASLGALLRDFCSSFQRARGLRLAPVTAGVFDQRHQTRSHRDQGPAESYLFLGYEASACGSRLVGVEDLLCARALGLEDLAELEARAHPLAPGSEAILKGYERPIGVLRPGCKALAVINNSRGEALGGAPTSLGLRHRAFLEENPTKSARKIRSVLMAPLSEESPK